ncbi:MAG TPA: hypothetical protein VIZ67_12235 [Acidimicrobiales bacterium]
MPGAVEVEHDRSAVPAEAARPDHDDGISRRAEPRSPRAALALALAPLVVSAVALAVAVGGDYRPEGDIAIIEMTTRAVGDHWPLVGNHSHDGWHHPGPALLYVLALPYRLLGGSSIGLPVGALAINGASVAGMAIVARRRGGVPLMLITLLGCALVMRSFGPEQLRLPWQPWVTVFPYGLLVFLTWAMACGDRWALPVAVLVGSFAAQTHVGYVALALPLVVLGAAWLFATHRRELTRLLWPSVCALGVALLAWLPPLIDELTNEPGNATLVARWFRNGTINGEGSHTLLEGWRVVSAQYALAPEWLAGTRSLVGFDPAPPYVSDPVVPVLLVAVALAVAVLWRRRVPQSGQLVAVWAGASVVGVIATSRVIGPLYAYRFGWARMLGMVAGVIVAWAAWRVVAERRPALERRVLTPIAVTAIAVLAVVGSVAHVRAGVPQQSESASISELVAPVLAVLPPGDGEVVVEGIDFFGTSYATGLVLQLERHGVDAGQPPTEPRRPEELHIYSGGPVRAHLTLALDDDVVDLTTRRDLRLVVLSGGLTLDELRVAVEASKQLEAIMAGERAVDHGQFDALVQAATLPRPAVGVFTEAPAAGP